MEKTLNLETKEYLTVKSYNMARKKIDIQKPDYYTAGDVECIDAIESATQNLLGIEAVCTANIIKYAWRWKEKNGKEDLQKAKWYLEFLIAKQ